MTRLFLASALAIAAHAVMPSQSAAQRATGVQIREGRTIDNLQTGARLRVTMRTDDELEPLRGRLRGFGATTMILEVEGAPRELPMSSILVIEESHRDRKRGALVGVLTAIVAVYAWDYFGPHPRYTDQDKRYKENIQALAIGVPVLGLVGGAIGWHRWRSVSTGLR